MSQSCLECFLHTVLAHLVHLVFTRLFILFFFSLYFSPWHSFKQSLQYLPDSSLSFCGCCATRMPNTLHQLIIGPTRISNNTSTLLDHILTNVYEKTSQSGIIDVGLSDHQLIFCTRKLIKQKKFGKHKMIKIRQMKNYTSELFSDELDKTNFPDYSQYEDVHTAYSHFSDKLSSVIERISPNKEVRIKNDNQEWFDGEVLEKIRIRDKLFYKIQKIEAPCLQGYLS